MNLAFFQEFFHGGQNLLLWKFLLLCYCFRTKLHGGVKVFRGELPQGAAPAPPPVEERQELLYGDYKKLTLFQNPVQKIPMISQSQTTYSPLQTISTLCCHGNQLEYTGRQGANGAGLSWKNLTSRG